MAFDIFGPHTHLANETCDLALFETAQRLNLLGPVLESLWREFYGTITIAPERVPRLEAEVEAVRLAYREEIAPRVARQKRVHAQDSARYEAILEPLLRKEVPLYGFMCSLLAVCREARAVGAEIRCEGD